MIIECINCNKRFNVNAELIPNEGRTIQCGSCNHVWFFKKSDISKQEIISKKTVDIPEISRKKPQTKKKSLNPNIKKADPLKPKVTKNINDKSFEIVEYKSKSNFTFTKFLSYTLVLIISLVALLIFLDTFKIPLYRFFPELEFLLFSLFETLKDIKLFIKDLI